MPATTKKSLRRYVSLTYPLSRFLADSRYDAQFVRLAKKHRGIESGSGAGRGGRDIGFIFKSPEASAEFVAAVKEEYKGVRTKIERVAVDEEEFLPRSTRKLTRLEVRVTYPLSRNRGRDFEDELEDYAKAARGEECGGETGGGERSLWFLFKRHASAEKFMSTVKKKYPRLKMAVEEPEEDLD